MVTQAEIEAAVDAYLIVGIGENVPAAMLAILEAAERVRPRRDPTNAKRSRQWRAKKRADRNVARNVAGDDASNVTRLAPGIGNVTGNVAGNRNVARNGVTFARNVPADLLERLLQAANRNVQPAAGEPHAIVSLIEQGCDLDLDVLPVVRNLLRDPLQPPLKSWSVPWLAAEIVRRRDERTCHVTPAPARAVPVRQPAAPPRRSGPPAAPSFDMDELVAGYRAGNVDWDVGRFGPPPGSPGCRVDAGILRANGYR